MKFVHPGIETNFSWDRPTVPTLVIENQPLFRTILQDISVAIDGISSPAILSVDNKPINMSHHAELIVDFIGFKLNQKPLLSKICGALERVAVDGEHYLATRQLLSDIENCISEWAFRFPCDIIATKVAPSTLLKSAGIEVRDDYSGASGELERIIDYMELVREFDRDKVYFMVNMRSYYSDDLMERFIKTVLSNEYKIILLESCARPVLKGERRTTIDTDLCEF